ncbi:MAG: flavodoxin family protein [Patescibacteria group bacterium]|jgi:flavodoxin
MKSLVVYESAFGNTKMIAERIAETLGAKLVQVKDFDKSDLEDLELIVVGSPINGWMPLPTIVNFLNTLAQGGLKGISATSFDTRVKIFIHGDAKGKIAKLLTKSGAKIIIEPAAFYVKGTEGPLLEGELDKAGEWAELIKAKTPT